MKELSVKGEIMKEFYFKDGFGVYQMETNLKGSPKSIKIVGNTSKLSLHQIYIAKVTKEINNYGIQYRIQMILPDGAPDTKDAFHFLKGITTENRAKTILEVYPDVLNRIIEGKEIDVSKLKRIDQEVWNNIVSRVQQHFILYEIIKEFDGILSNNFAEKLIATYQTKSQILYELKKRPYVAMCKCKGIGFKKADEWLLKAEEHFREKNGIIPLKKDLRRSKERCLEFIDYFLKENEQAGSSRVSLSKIQKEADQTVPECSNWVKECVKEESYFQYRYPAVSRKQTFQKEAYIVDKMKELLESDEVDCRWKNIDPEEFRDLEDFSLTNDQLSLLDILTQTRLVILNGPAGTGKSSTVEAVCHMAKSYSLKIRLMSPTGKAAKVLAGYTNEPVETIHRAIGLGMESEKEQQIEKMEDVDLLIVDEFSMVNLDLFYYFMKAVNTEKNRVVLIGDDAQLPCVGTGNLLHDFLQESEIPSVTLTEVFRYGNNGIMKTATDTRKSEQFLKSFMKDNETKSFGDGDEYTFYETPEDNLLEKVVATYQQLLKKGLPPGDIQVLTAYNKGKYGVDVFNERLRKLVNPKKEDDPCFQFHMKNTKESREFYEGDYVMETKNNYILKTIEGEKAGLIANGETGTIEKIKKEEVWIRYGERVVVYERKDMLSVKLAYSITFHKSQGSSITHPIIVTPKAHAFMLNANIIYVGISRAKEKVSHFGNAAIVNKAIKKQEEQKRKSNIKYLFGLTHNVLTTKLVS